MNPRWTHVRPCSITCHHHVFKKPRLLSSRLHAVLLIFSGLTSWVRCVQFLSVILLISSAFHVLHLWTSLLSVSAHAWVECGTAPTTAAQVCAVPLWVVVFLLKLCCRSHSNSMTQCDYFITTQRCSQQVISSSSFYVLFM